MRTSNYNLASMLHGRTILTLTTAIGMSLFAFAPLQAQDTLPENNGIISITSQDDGDGSSSADNDSAQLAMAAAAQNGDNNSSSFTISGNATIVSDYRFRGVSLSDGDFAIQGGIDISHDSGFYAGIWGSSIEDSPLLAIAKSIFMAVGAEKSPLALPPMPACSSISTPMGKIAILMAIA